MPRGPRPVYGPAVIIVGDVHPYEGVYGPFKTDKEAEAYGKKTWGLKGTLPEWSVKLLIHPKADKVEDTKE